MKLNIYPNPASSFAEIIQPREFVVYNLLGQKVFPPLAEVPAGIYFLVEKGIDRPPCIGKLMITKQLDGDSMGMKICFMLSTVEPEIEREARVSSIARQVLSIPCCHTDMKHEILAENPRIELYEGDCLEIMPTLPDKSFDLVLTDPPYGITPCEWDNIPNLEKLWIELKHVGKENCAYVFTASQPFTTDLINSNRKWFKYEWIWDKQAITGIGLVNKMPMKCHENIIVFYNKQPEYNPQKRPVLKPFGKIKTSNSVSIGLNPDKNKRFGVGYPKTIITYQRPNNLSSDKSGLHPTQKPINLMKYLIATYTNDSNTILDPFAGSGTTGVAAFKLNRNCTMIEIEPKYCDIIRKRIDILARQERLF